MKRIQLFVLILVLGICALYIPHQNLFFSTDDWFHLRLAQIESPQEFFNFFSFQKNEQTASFYRPIPTQVFFFVLQTIFGLQAMPYYWVALGFFAVLLLLIFKLGREFGLNTFQAVIATLLYGVASSNIPRLQFLSAFQEISMTLFVVLAVLIFLKLQQMKKSPVQTAAACVLFLITFALALGSKETAIVVPFILTGLLIRGILVDIFTQKTNVHSVVVKSIHQSKNEMLVLAVGLVIALAYLYARLTIFGSAEGDTYVWNTSIKSIIHTFSWYSIWTLGAPEMLIDYVGSGFKILPSFFADYGSWSYPVLAGLLASATGLGVFLSTRLVTLIRSVNASNKSLDTLFLVAFFAGAFVLSLAPVLFLPLHKFSHALGLPLVWFALGIATLIPKSLDLKNGIFISLLLLPYVGYNLAMHPVYQKWHYSQNRALISKKVFNFFSEKYPVAPKDKQFFFINDFDPGGGTSWGSSKQISHSTMQSEMWRVLYRDHAYVVLFQDLPEQYSSNKKENKNLNFFNRISVSSRQFLTE